MGNRAAAVTSSIGDFDEGALAVARRLRILNVRTSVATAQSVRPPMLPLPGSKSTELWTESRVALHVSLPVRPLGQSLSNKSQ